MIKSLSEPLLQDRTSMLFQDRRRCDRTPARQQGTHVWLTRHHRVPVELIDESSTGIGVVIPDASFNLGPHINVDHQGKRRTAVVAYLNKNADGRYHLGLEWASLREV